MTGNIKYPARTSLHQTNTRPPPRHRPGPRHQWAQCLGQARGAPGGDALVPVVPEYARNSAPKPPPGENTVGRARGPAGTVATIPPWVGAPAPGRYLVLGKETQPVPNPIAYFMHRSPWWFHRFETLVNHFIELLVPFFLLLGRRMSIVHGLLQILFQVLLIISGNLSFLNWLTMVPSIACFDDASLGFLFSSRRGAVKERVVQMQLQEAAGEQLPPRYGCYVRKVVNISLGLLIAYLSIPVVINLLSSRQVMNTSFNPLRIVNTYGAFGSITKERTEVVLQGTSSLDPNDPAAVWEEYDFKCKPGDLKRRPCFITPYHYRLDWLMWFAAFQTYEQNEWIIHLAGKLLAQEEETLSLMATNPFAGREPPRWIRGEHFKYKFSQPGGKHASEGRWWIRKRIGPYFPPVNLQGLKKFFEDRNWPYPARD